MRTKHYLSYLLSTIPIIGYAAETTPEKPNIVIIIADDLGTNELGCYGGQNLLTPNIDRLSQEGIRLTNNYASCAMSVPIRASLYTGLYPVRHGSFQNHKKTYSNIKSSAHYLSDLGYRVGRTGKDHPVNQPNVYSFENIPGFTVGCTSATANYTTNGIEEFINRNNDQPFCLYVCSIHPHTPWTWGDASKFNPDSVILPPNCVDNTKTRNDFCNYLAEIQALDNEVGSVLEVLENSGQLDNTLVIFLGEQGPQMPFGKWTCYRYGQHSAFLARYPSKITPNTTSDALVQYEDILPTIIDFSGGNEIPGLDGKSCLGVLFGEKEEHREWAYGIHNNIPAGTSYPIRSIQDKRYKLILNLTPEADVYITAMMNPDQQNMWASWLTSAKTDNFAKFLTDRFVNRPAVEFYDMQEDEWELNNIANRPEHAARISTMRAELEKWMDEQGDLGPLMDTDKPIDQPPLAISNAEDIDTYMRTNLVGNFFLTNDIDLSGIQNWIPIGAKSNADNAPELFRGIFDGKGYAIKNLKIDSDNNFKGFFGRIDNALIKDVEFLDVNIKGGATVGTLTGAIRAESVIERVSVTGNIEGNTEIGGLAGRVATVNTKTGYNTIKDCYVNANITAHAVSNNSMAAGIVAVSKNPSNVNYGKIEFRNVYVAGKIKSAWTNNAENSNVAGIIAVSENHPYIKMNEVLVLADEISAGTPNLVYSRNGINYNDFEAFNKIYARSDIVLNYADNNNRGPGGEIPDGVIQLSSLETFKTRQFYTDNLSWDFDNTWTINEGSLPVLRRKSQTNNQLNPKINEHCRLYPGLNELYIYPLSGISVDIFDMTGSKVFLAENLIVPQTIPLSKGIYLIHAYNENQKMSCKVIIH